jgi:two-component system, NtrC family, response regulator AtoC
MVVERVLLVIADGQLSYHSLPAPGHDATLRIGRSSHCEVKIDHPSISPVHAVLRIGAGCTIEDRTGSDGVRLGHRPIEAMTPIDVAFGDLIELGEVHVMLQTRVVPASGARVSEPPDELDDIRPPRGALPPDAAVLARIAAGTISVLILGETGVGKEVLAEQIHRASRRADHPLIRLNCAALSETLLESELFGHERGAFTGATSAKPGLIEAAEGGTVFLDEIGELPMATQVKLLRVLESREILPVGGVKPRAVDVRFISATHRDLEAAIERGTFRADLYYRLNGVALHIDPLRRRVREIAGLARTFIAQACRGLGRRPPALSPEALRLLESYPWPGNIRELRNVIELAVLFCPAEVIETEQLSIDLRSPLPRRMGSQPSAPRSPAPRAPVPRPPVPRSPGPRSPAPWPGEPAPARVAGEDHADPHGPYAGEGMTVQRELEMIEKQRILEALETCAGNQSRAAKMLAIPRRTLLKRLDAYQIPRPRKRPSAA